MTDIDAEAMASVGAPEWMEVERFFEKKDRQYAKSYLEEQARYENLHEEARVGIHACKVQRAAMTRTGEVISAKLEEVDKNIRTQTREYRQKRHEMETELERVHEKRLADVKVLYDLDQASREQGTKYTNQANNEICHLYNEIEQAKKFRTQKSEKLQQVVSERLDEIQVAISAEQKFRESSTSTLLELFGQMGVKMQTEIDAVKAERQIGTSRIIALMEGVLPHLEQARQNHLKASSEKLEDQKAAAALAHDATEKWQRRQQIQRKSSLSAGAPTVPKSKRSSAASVNLSKPLQLLRASRASMSEAASRGSFYSDDSRCVSPATNRSAPPVLLTER